MTCANLDGFFLDALWDFDDTEATRERLLDVQQHAESPISDELATQVARTYRLERRFAEGHIVLDQITSDDPVLRQRLALERGRLFKTDGLTEEAIKYFAEAATLAADPYLTVDAFHMLAIADPDNSQSYTDAGLALARTSQDPRVMRWEGSLLNNHAWNLADTGDEAGSLPVFVDADIWFSIHGDPHQILMARWALAHMLRRTGNIEKARTYLSELHDQFPQHPMIIEEMRRLVEE